MLVDNDPLRGPVASGVDFSALYDEHPEYVARRAPGSIEQAQIDLEVRLFKVPQLLMLLPAGRVLGDVLEIGCATGELLHAMPVRSGARKLGIDISAANVAAARERFPEHAFECGDFRETVRKRFDAVVMSDVLEHVPDDVAFLRDAASMAETVLVNLPLEDNWLNRRRRYGPDDVSGHLRRYSLADGLALFGRAGLEIVAYRQVWVHETATEAARRALQRERLGSAYSGGRLQQMAKAAVFATAAAWPVIGRRVFASNLFAAARLRPAR